MKLNVDQSLRKAGTLAKQGLTEEAEQIGRAVLAAFPGNRRALAFVNALSAPPSREAYDGGVRTILGLLDQGRPREAFDQALALIDTYPLEADLHNLAGAAAGGLGRLEEALSRYDRAIELNPDYADVHSNRGITLLRLQRLEEALDSCSRAAELQPGSAGAHSNRGLVLKQLGRLDEALSCYDAAVRLDPNSPEIQYNRGNLLQSLGRHREAVAGYDAALRHQPAYAAAHSNRGNALKKLGDLYGALESYDAAIRFRPDAADAYSNRGCVLQELKRLDEALVSCERAVDLQPESAEIQYNCGAALQALRRLADAIACYDEAIRLRPGHADSYANRGGALHGLQRLDEALQCYDQVVQLDPCAAAGYYNRANVLQEMGRLDEAVASYRKAVELNPGYAEAQGQLLFQQARMCEWEDADAAGLAGLGVTTGAITPFTFFGIEDDPQNHLLRAKKWIREKCDNRAPLIAVGNASSSRIRIGYFSADFHNHATMHLLAKLLETHDRTRFEIHAFSYGIDRFDEMRRRAVDAVDKFHEVGALSDRAVAELARREQIDIAVDLKGHSQEMRIGIFSYRAAPVQIGYLGYPGSVGADFIDYIVADEIVLPERSRNFYAEKVIYLPDCYQANDPRSMSDRAFTRSELGLPENGFVFCSFNNSYKIRPAEFGIWMNLLSQVDHSILWLLSDNRWAEANLRKEAAARGIDPDRLIFAERMPLPDHLARHRCADLFLDTFNCNAHTTASDALWAGLPLLTKMGESFAARVAGSLLRAIGIPELAVETAEAYARLALDLATDPSRLADIRARLEANRSSAPLFDIERYARHIERGYALAHARYRDGLATAHINVPAEIDRDRRAAA